MKKIIIIVFLLCSITIQAKESKEHKTKKKPVQYELVNTSVQSIQTGPWDELVRFIEFITSPFRPVWGDYKEFEMRSGNPYLKTIIFE